MSRTWFILAAALAAAAAGAAPRSAMQQERDAQRERLRREVELKKQVDMDRQERAEIQRREEAEEKALYANPEAHYRERVKGRYRVVDGRPEALRLLGGKILQVADNESVLLDAGNYTFAIRMGTTAGLVDGQPLRVYVVPNGTLSFTTVLGARRTVPAFTQQAGMTFDEYKALRAAGVDLSSLGRS
jgi:hypothetical protein